MTSDTLLTIKDLTIRFKRSNAPDLLASRNVSFDIGQHETVALVGESGSGKTTIGKALVHLVPVSSGHLWFDGHDVTHLRRVGILHYRRLTQMIFQDPFASLNPFHPVSHHLQRPLARLRNLRGPERERAVDELLNLVGLSPAMYRNKYPHELSGGQRQRVAIARALASQPRLVVADEPVSMLDVSLRADVLHLLESLQQTQHLSYLYITHDLASARYLAQRIVVLYAGSILEVANAEDLVVAPAHPYTQLLLAATPGGPAGKLPEIAQVAPDLTEARQGCPFAPRCPYAIARCSVEMPSLSPVARDHRAACFLLE